MELDKMFVRVGAQTDEAEKELTGVMNKINAIRDAMIRFQKVSQLNAGLIKPTKAFEQITKEIMWAEKQAQKLQSKIDALISNPNVKPGPAFDKALDDLYAQLDAIQGYTKGLEDVRDQMIRTEQAFEDVRPPSFIADLRAFFKEVRQDIPLPKGLAKVRYLFQTIAENAKGTGRRIKHTIQGIINDVKKPIGWLQKLAKGFGAVVSRIPLLGGAAKTAKSGISDVVSKIFKLISVIYLLRKATDLAKEGYGNLTAYDSASKASIDALELSLQTLKNAWATAFAPIINYVAPIIVTLIDWVTAAATAIAHLMAALTGQAQVVVARKASASVSEGISGTGAAADKAKKSVEEYQRTLLGFDQINRLDAPKGSGGSGGGGSGGGGSAGGGGNDMFETVTIGANAASLAERIREAWENGADFTWLGELVAEKLNNALKNIPWEKIKEVAGKLGTSIATFFNGIFRDSDLWYNIGKTIIEGLNTAIGFVYSLVTDLDWSAVGTAFGNAVNGMVENLDAEKLGKAISNFVKGIFNSIAEFLATIHWDQIGYAIMELIFNIDWKGIGKALLKMLFYGLLSAFEIFGPLFPASIQKKIDEALGGQSYTEFFHDKLEGSMTQDGLEEALSITYATPEGELVTIPLKGEVVELDKSKLTEPQRTISNAIGKITGTSWSLDNKAKTAAGMIAKFTVASWGLAKKAKTVSGFSAKFTSRVIKFSTSVNMTANIAAAKITGAAKTTLKSILKLAGGGIYTGGSWKPVTYAAGGGSFSNGQMFIAREAGPELVGTIGGHTAVMNNGQIVESVKAGVYQAVLAAMSQTNGQTPVIISLEGDTARFFKAIQKEAKDYTNATGLSPFPV